MVKNLPAMKETGAQSLDQEDLLEKRMAIRSSVLFSFVVEFLFLTTPPQPPFLAPVFLPGESHGQRSLAPTVHGIKKFRTRLSD